MPLKTRATDTEARSKLRVSPKGDMVQLPAPPAEGTKEDDTQLAVKEVKYLPADMHMGETDEDGYFIPRPDAIEVDCELYAAIGLRVGFNVRLAYQIIAEGYECPGATPAERLCRKLALMAPVFRNWKVKEPITRVIIPTPDPDKWETYLPIASATGVMNPLTGWILGVGLTKALRAAAGNSSPASKRP